MLVQIVASLIRAADRKMDNRVFPSEQELKMLLHFSTDRLSGLCYLTNDWVVVSGLQIKSVVCSWPFKAPSIRLQTITKTFLHLKVSRNVWQKPKCFWVKQKYQEKQLSLLPNGPLSERFGVSWCCYARVNKQVHKCKYEHGQIDTQQAETSAWRRGRSGRMWRVHPSPWDVHIHQRNGITWGQKSGTWEEKLWEGKCSKRKQMEERETENGKEGSVFVCCWVCAAECCQSCNQAGCSRKITPQWSAQITAIKNVPSRLNERLQILLPMWISAV